MNDLDQLITDVFERRAATAPVSLSPEVVRHAIRRARIRTAKLSVASLTVVVGLVAGAMATGGGHPRGAVAPAATPTASPQHPQVDPSARVLASLPWSGVERLQLRGSDLPDDQPALCVGTTCGPPADLSGTLAAEPLLDGLAGTAPAATVRVRVRVGTSAAITVPVTAAAAGTFGPAVLFGAPNAKVQLEPTGFLTHAVHIDALDAQGGVIASIDRPGSDELARAHPPVTAVVGLPETQPQPEVTWISSGGWTCIGYRVPVRGTPELGAENCQHAANPSTIAWLTPGAWPLRYLLLQVPTSTTSVVLTSNHGVEHRATFLSTRLAELAIVRTGGPDVNGRSILTVRGKAGVVLFHGPLNTLATGGG